MKTKQTLTFSIVPAPIEFSLDIVEFDPPAVFGEGWKFAPEINGPANNDGITAFQTAIVKASTLSKEEGRRLLFLTGIKPGQGKITGNERLKVLAKLPLADPDLLYSLVKEKGQKTLRYLNETYGVTYMEALRRVLLRPGGGRCSLCLGRCSVGSWSYYDGWLDSGRGTGSPALSLAV